MTNAAVITPIKLQIPPTEFVELNKPIYAPSGEKIYREKDIPVVVTLDWLSEYLGVSKHTIGSYRKIAYKCVDAYRKSATKRHPQYARERVAYLQRKAKSAKRPPTPDPPPFEQEEVIILAAIATLFKIYRNQSGAPRLVEAHIQTNPDFYQDLEKLWQEKQQRQQQQRHWKKG